MLTSASDLGNNNGVDKDRIYTGTVVFNDDPDMLGRVKVFVPELFASDDPNYLPWSIPSLDHPSAGEGEGVFYVPDIGSETHIQYQDGNTKFGIYGDFHVTMKTRLDEIKHNYPDRLMLIKLKDKFMILYDRREHRLFIRNPGKAHISILGDVDLQVFGNSVEKVAGDKTVVVGGTLTTVAKNIRQHSAGNTEVSSVGDYTNTSALRSIGCTGHNFYASGVENYTITGISYRIAAKILNNPPGMSGATVDALVAPSEPTLPEWTAIKGGAKGE